MSGKGFDVEILPGVIVHVDSFRVAPSRIFLDGQEVKGKLQLTVKDSPADSYDDLETVPNVATDPNGPTLSILMEHKPT